jgi:tryptophanase
LGFCYRELTDKNEKGERVVIESDYGPAYDETAQICRITGEITMTQEQYETEFESDPAYKKKAGVTNLQEAVEDVMWETYSLGHSFPSPVSA